LVTSDTAEFDFETNTVKTRTGSLLVDNIEVENCSQIDTFNAAIRFEGATKKHSSVTSSTFHSGLGWGAAITNSANIFMKDNIWFNFRPIGVAIDFSRNITFDNNVVGKIVPRTTV